MPTREKGSRYSGGEKGKAPMGEKPSSREKGSRYPGGQGVNASGIGSADESEG